MQASLYVRLWIMVFVQYLIWGAWYSTMGTYLTKTLHFAGGDVGLAYGTPAIGAMISPFFVGMIADRFFATERILAVLHLIGAVLLYFISTLTTFGTFYPCLIAYTICYMATLALTNSLTLHQLTNPGRQFPLVMFMGSIGWIVSGLIVGQGKIEDSGMIFKVAAMASAFMGFYSMTLPHTPPKGRGNKVTMREILGLDALRLMRNRSFATFVIGSFLICIPLSFYFAWTNLFLTELHVTNPASKMTIGQVSDVVFLLLMPFFVGWIGAKRVLLLGMLAWAARFFLFSKVEPSNPAFWMVYVAIALHGMCYDFFFVMGRIYVDKRAPVEIRGTTQGFLAFVTLGAGMLIGTFLSGVVGQRYTYQVGTETLHHWDKIWFVPAVMAAAVLVLFALLFKDESVEDRPLNSLASEAPRGPDSAV